MFDAHCHLDFPVFDATREVVLERAMALGVEGFLVAGVEPTGWERQHALGQRFDSLHLAYGLHPWTVAGMSQAEVSLALDSLGTALEGRDGVFPVALGETGLDRSRRVAKESLPVQERAFRLQLSLARALDLPVVLHIVRSHGRALDIVRQDGLPRAGGLVHAFSASAEVAHAWVRVGAHISFSTALARRGAKRARAAASIVPLERVLIESDAPDQSPFPDSDLPNEPANLPYALRALASLRQESEAEIAERTTLNARALFKV